VADSSSASLEYESDLFYVAVAHDWDIDGDGVETLRLAGGNTFGPIKLMLLYQQTDTGVEKEDGFGASLAWTFGTNTAKFQYLTADIWRTDPQVDPLENLLESQFSVGLDHEFGENTKLFGFYTTGDIGGTSETNSYVAIGIEHNF
jgi:Gram-negative porin